MKLFTRRHLTLVAPSLVFATWQLRAQEEPLCVENSPERRGEIGCSIHRHEIAACRPEGAGVLAYRPL